MCAVSNGPKAEHGASGRSAKSPLYVPGPAGKIPGAKEVPAAGRGRIARDGTGRRRGRAGARGGVEDEGEEGDGHRWEGLAGLLAAGATGAVDDGVPRRLAARRGGGRGPGAPGQYVRISDRA